jgi:hypothetical protein
MMCVQVTGCRRLVKGSLRGFARVELPELRLVLRNVAVHESSGSRWAALPARPQLHPRGIPIRNDDSRVRFATMFDFFDSAARQNFSRAVITALLERFPDAFNERGDAA